MKKYGIIAFAIAFTISLSALAQDSLSNRPHREQKNDFRKEMKEKLTPKKRAGFMAVDMELTDVQRDKLQALFEKENVLHEKQMAEIKKFRDEQKAKMDAMKKTYETEMEKILGPEKFQQWKAKQAEKRERMERMMKWHNQGRENRSGNFRGQRPPMPPANTPAPPAPTK